MNLRSMNRRMSADRHLAASPKYREKRSLGGNRNTRGLMFQSMRDAMRLALIVARLDGQRALPDGRNHDVHRNQLRDAIRPSQAPQARRRENNGIVLSFVELPNPRVYITTQSLYRDSAMHCLELH